MGREIVLFKSEEKKSRGEAAAFLRELADKLEAGRIALRQAGEETVLEPSEMLELEVKAEEETKSKGVQLSLEVELVWYPGAQDKPGGVRLG
ncbi:amphi-Trp domain-containing protein [Oceanidesulfovibrio indonesiensis]|uniref:Amphi-Trp domain-containing protein n=1 Tax=Oceanidesulfovibrio indonesiensis TaxID=54767 RepID=A0A7M3MES2_9BACT|nr:amphi-Trp domain-containing protein [Oceanidesulfovibrio indonesiensis]TVM17395.1 amphi-Trp domain-containing protein [Oceanidesulfovibrio indonesiensis]